MSALVEIRDLTKHYPVRRGLLRRSTATVRALEGVDLDLRRGECFALVGESGSGKTTLGRCLMRLLEPTRGSIRFDGIDLLALSGESLRTARRRFQMVFQDPYGSLNPRMRVGQIVGEPLAVHRLGSRPERHRRISELLEMVGMPARAARRYPHEFSGGQRQRIGIARALATDPDLLVADEPVSSLDVSVRGQIINLLARLQDRLGLTLLFIAHDLAVVEQIAHRVGVLYLGKLVETGETGAVFRAPQHPYTASLLASVPHPETGGERRRLRLPGEVPTAIDPPSGCSFHPRCPIARERCAHDEPALRQALPERLVSCHYPGEAITAERDEPGEPPL